MLAVKTVLSDSTRRTRERDVGRPVLTRWQPYPSVHCERGFSLHAKLLQFSVCEFDNIDKTAMWRCKDTGHVTLKFNTLNEKLSRVCFISEF